MPGSPTGRWLTSLLKFMVLESTHVSLIGMLHPGDVTFDSRKLLVRGNAVRGLRLVGV